MVSLQKARCHHPTTCYNQGSGMQGLLLYIMFVDPGIGAIAQGNSVYGSVHSVTVAYTVFMVV